MAEVEKDDLLADVRAADAELNAEPEENTPAPAESAEDKAERVRDEAGRFAKAEQDKAAVPRETLKLKSKEAAEAPPGSEVKTPQEPAAAAPSQGAAAAGTAPNKAAGLEIPPVYWNGDAKVAWGKLPQPVRAAVVAQTERLSAMEAEYSPVRQALEPWKETLVRDAGSVESGVSQLMQFYKLFLENPHALIHAISRTRGIDLAQLVGQSGQPGTPQAPDINSLVMQAVQQQFAPIQEQIEQTKTQQVAQTLDEFAADPRHPYFQDVRVDMGVLIQTNRARNLQEAYDKACRMNDTIWSTLEAQKTEDAKGSQAAAAEKARRAAAASVRGSPLPNGASGSTSQTSSVLDDVRAADAELSGA